MICFDEDFGNWLAGFTAAEGCFCLRDNVRNGLHYRGAMYKISLRSDENDFEIWKRGVALLHQVKNRPVVSDGLQFYTKWHKGEQEQFLRLRSELRNVRRFISA